MADNELRDLFSKNLRSWLQERGKTQADLRRYMDVSSATASDWCNGRKIPRADKLRSICAWLGVELNDLLTEKEADTPAYYLDPETAALAQEMFEDPDMRSLFSMKRNMDPKAFKNYMDFMKAQYKLEHPED